MCVKPLNYSFFYGRLLRSLFQLKQQQTKKGYWAIMYYERKSYERCTENSLVIVRMILIGFYSDYSISEQLQEYCWKGAVNLGSGALPSLLNSVKETTFVNLISRVSFPYDYSLNFQRTYIHTSHNWLLQSFSNDYHLTSHTTYVASDNFIHEWRDQQFKVDSERQIFMKLFTAHLFTLRVFDRNLHYFGRVQSPKLS